MKKSIAPISFLVVLLMFCFVLPTHAKMSPQNTSQESLLEQSNKPMTLKEKIAKKALTKRVKKMKKQSKIFKTNVSNDDLVRWILIGVAILVGIALINFIGGLLGNILGLLLLVVVIWLLLSLLGVI